jgi:glycosyltransferase involved in cell wall biosynthesis
MTVLQERLAGLPVALVHDWLLGMRGGEWVLASLLKLFPAACLHTLFYRPEALVKAINMHAVHPSGLNHWPGVQRYYRWLLPLLPAAIERVRIKPRTALVLATSHCVAHGVRAPAGAVRVNYYFSPMRYLYDQQAVYRKSGGLAGRALAWATPRLTRWDQAAARRADYAWAISRFVARRIEEAYGLSARVIYPPVRTTVYRPPESSARVDEYLIVSAMVPYKRIDLAIHAANRLRRKLRVIGSGPMLGQIARLAGPTVTIEGKVSQRRLIELYQTRRGLIFPGEEDFGIVPLEAMACALPVLALRAGGLLETLPEGVCGAFFERPTVESLAEAWEAFNPEAYDPAQLRANAERYAEERFLDEVARGLAACGLA